MASWAALRAEAVGTWLEVRLEDWLEHQLQRGLHDPVCGRRDPQRTDLAARFGDRLLPHPLGDEPAGLEIVSQPAEQSRSTEHDRAGCHSVDAGGSCALVAPHPCPRHDEERRVIHEVGEVIETTARIGHRPLVQLRLHHEYPPLGLVEAGPRSAGVHQRSPRSTWMLQNTLDPFAMWPAFPASDYYGSSAPPRWHRPATGLPAGQQAAGRGGDRRE
jgi:hypothetical protein